MDKPRCNDCKIDMFIKEQNFTDEMEDVFKCPKCRIEMTREEFEESHDQTQ